jgi:hypothetical protein
MSSNYRTPTNAYTDFVSITIYASYEHVKIRQAYFKTQLSAFKLSVLNWLPNLSVPHDNIYLTKL